MSKLIRLPGLIDIHVHLRDPGQTYKEDFYTGTYAALAGGVTAVFDMPNKSFHVISKEELDKKVSIAKQKAVCDWGLYFGTDGDNTQDFAEVIDRVVGLKIYLNVTTGHVLIPDEKLEYVFQKWPKTKPIVIHIEDERIAHVINLANRFGNKIHITHVNTQSLLEKIIEAKKNNKNITCDVTPHHLFLTEDKLKTMKGFAMVKPPLATQDDVDFLWENLGLIDCIATDHAPHTIEEKKSENPPTGLPGVETMIPLLLNAVSKGWLSLNDLIRLTSINPRKIFGLRQDRETYVEVDTQEKYIIENNKLFTKCGWSPYAGWEIRGKIKNVFIRGFKVFSEGKVLVKEGFGKQVQMDA